LGDTKVVQMVKDGCLSQQILVGAGLVLIRVALLNGAEKFIIVNFRAQMPGIEEGEVVLRAMVGVRSALEGQSGDTGRNVGDNIFIVDNSEVLREVAEDFLGEVNFSDSWGTEGPQFEVRLGD